jgi:hypothetical protein
MPALTKTYLAAGKFCFHPKTENEARLIQERLISMGFCWRRGEKEPLYLDILAKGALELTDGVMTYAAERKKSGMLLRYEQFDPDYIADDRDYLAAMFNKVFARMDALEKRLDGLESAVLPQKIEKGTGKLLALPRRKGGLP